MKFTIESNELQKALTKISGAIPSKSTLPILENVLFSLTGNKLVLTATDLELSISALLDVKGSEDGTIAVPARRVMETLRAMLNVPLVFNADESSNKIKMITETGEYALIGESGKEYPTLPEFKGDSTIKISSSTLKSMISKAIFAVSSDELRPAMTGLLLQLMKNEIRGVATDGHRLVKISYKIAIEKNSIKNTGELDKSIIIPSKTLSLIPKIAEDGSCSISINPTHIKFDFNNLTLSSRLIEETYPNYETVIPLDNDKKLQIDRNVLLASIRRVAIYSSTTTHQIRLSIKKNEIKISAEDIDFGGEAKERLVCKYNADDLEIGFNAFYLIDILSHLESDEVIFLFGSSVKAVIITEAVPKENEDTLMLVMPMRINV